MRARSLVLTPLRATAAIAAAVIALDVASKQLALALLRDDVVPLGAGTFLGLVYNPTFALGYSLGGHSLLAAALVSLLVVGLIALVCRPLTSAAPQAPWTLGLIAGFILLMRRRDSHPTAPPRGGDPEARSAVERHA